MVRHCPYAAYWDGLTVCAPPHHVRGSGLRVPRYFILLDGNVCLVTGEVLLPSELAYLLVHGETGRDELLQRFGQGGRRNLSRASSQPVV